MYCIHLVKDSYYCCDLFFFALQLFRKVHPLFQTLDPPLYSYVLILFFKILPFHRLFAKQTGSSQLVQGFPEKHTDQTYHHHH